MMNDDGQASSKASAYPYAPLAEALKVGKGVHALGGAKEGVSKALLANQLQVKEDAPSFSHWISAAKSFGIIQGYKQYTIPTSALRYFQPEYETDDKVALLGFLANPPVFKAIIDKFDGNGLPKTAMLANVLKNLKLVPSSWAPKTAQMFVSSASLLGVIDQAGILRFNATKHGIKNKGPGVAATQGGSPEKQESKSEGGTVKGPLKVGDLDVVDSAEIYRFQGVVLSIPENISPEAWAKLNKIVQAIKPEEE